MSFAQVADGLARRLEAVLDEAAEGLAATLGGTVERIAGRRRVTLGAAAAAREFGTSARPARPAASAALAGLDLAAATTAALREAIADDT